MLLVYKMVLMNRRTLAKVILSFVTSVVLGSMRQQEIQAVLYSHTCPAQLSHSMEKHQLHSLGAMRKIKQLHSQLG